MSIEILTPNPIVGQIIKLKLKYEGDKPAPNDVHVDWKNPEVEEGEEGEWVEVTGWPNIPSHDLEGKPINPTQGFEFPVSPGGWSTTGSEGKHHLRVRWTRHEPGQAKGNTIHTELVDFTTKRRPYEPPRKEWDWFVFLGKVLAGALTSGVAGIILNWWTGVGIVPCLITGAAGGAAGSGLGHIIVHLFDAPRKWTFKSSFLFTVFFTLMFSMLFGILAIELEKEAIEMGDIYNRVTFGVGLVAAFLASTLPGVLDNLKYDAE